MPPLPIFIPIIYEGLGLVMSTLSHDLTCLLKGGTDVSLHQHMVPTGTGPMPISAGSENCLQEQQNQLRKVQSCLAYFHHLLFQSPLKL